MAPDRLALQDLLDRIEAELPTWLANPHSHGDLCNAIAGWAEQAVDGGIAAEDDRWFHDQLRKLCQRHDLPSVQF